MLVLAGCGPWRVVLVPRISILFYSRVNFYFCLLMTTQHLKIFISHSPVWHPAGCQEILQPGLYLAYSRVLSCSGYGPTMYKNTGVICKVVWLVGNWFGDVANTGRSSSMQVMFKWSKGYVWRLGGMGSWACVDLIRKEVGGRSEKIIFFLDSHNKVVQGVAPHF